MDSGSETRGHQRDVDRKDQGSAFVDYSFRPNLFQKSRHVRLSGDCFEIINGQGQVVRSINLGHVRHVREYVGGQFEDPDRGRCRMDHCIVSCASGADIVLKSASYTGARSGRDQSSEYTCFVGELIHRLARIQPDTPLITGSMGVVIAWVIVGVLGFGLLLLGMVILARPLFTSDTPAQVFPPGIVCCVGGAGTTFMSLGMVQTYYPTRTTAAARVGVQQP